MVYSRRNCRLWLLRRGGSLDALLILILLNLALPAAVDLGLLLYVRRYIACLEELLTGEIKHRWRSGARTSLQRKVRGSLLPCLKTADCAWIACVGLRRDIVDRGRRREFRHFDIMRGSIRDHSGGDAALVWGR